MKLSSAHFHKILVSVSVLSFLFIATTLFSYFLYKHQIVQAAKQGVQWEIEHLVGQIESSLKRAGEALDLLEKEIAAGKLSEKELAKKIEGSVAGNPQILKTEWVSISATPEGNKQYRSVSYQRRDGKVSSAFGKEEPRDYSQEEWFEQAAARGAGWYEPFWDEGTKNYAAVYSVPVYRGEGAPKEQWGVLAATVSLGVLRENMDSMNLKREDFGIVLSKTGNILFHPVGDYLVNRTNIFDLLASNKETNKNYEKQRSVMQKAVSGASGEGYNIGRTGQPFWYFYRPIRPTGWSVIVYFVKDTIPMNSRDLRRQVIQMAGGLILLAVSLAALFFRLYEKSCITHPKLWFLSMLFAVACILATGFIWALTLVAPLSEYQKNKTVIDDPVSLGKFSASCSKVYVALHGKEPAYIPTGIYIQSLEFSNSSNVNITGYVWQRYTKGAQDRLSRGFVMPEARTLTVTEAYRFDRDKEEVIGWYFEGTLRPSFNYSKYPFDHPNIGVWLRHKNFFEDIVLVPDLQGYPFTNPAMCPGLRSKLPLPGYAFSGTFFSYEPKRTSATFGAPAQKQDVRPQELVYNILIKRNFITPLVSKFFPIFIVLAMLFIVILSFSDDTERLKNFGLTGFAVVGLVVSFFFSTLLTQIDLRQQFNADGIIFIENFNFITYFILLLCAVLAYLFAAKRRIGFIHYEHCLIPKLLYWPIFTGLMFVISLIYFY
ncbi:MAG: cache domain-containing protein [Candidatus Omnitrophota bacterium]|jgi:hypothetical protein